MEPTGNTLAHNFGRNLWASRKMRVALVFWKPPSLFTSDSSLERPKLTEIENATTGSRFQRMKIERTRTAEIALNGVYIVQSKKVERARAQKAGRSEEFEITPQNMNGNMRKGSGLQSYIREQ